MQLKILLNRQLPGKVKYDPSSVERFFDVVLDSHIIVAAALVLFGMDDVDSQPTQNVENGEVGVPACLKFYKYS